MCVCLSDSQGTNLRYACLNKKPTRVLIAKRVIESTASTELCRLPEVTERPDLVSEKSMTAAIAAIDEKKA